MLIGDEKSGSGNCAGLLEGPAWVESCHTFRPIVRVPTWRAGTEARLELQPQSLTDLGVVKSDALDDAGEHLAVGLRGGRRHGHGQDYSPCVHCGRARVGRRWAGVAALGLAAKGSKPSAWAKMGAKGYQPSGCAIRLGH